MSAWRPRLEEKARLKYLGIVEALEADIRAGRVHPGDRLPAQRGVAEALDVDLTTVTRAFNEARRRGLIDAQAGRGTFIRERLDDVLGPARLEAVTVLDLSMNSPPQPAAANLQQAIPAGIAEILSNARGMLHLHYQESAGSASDRAAAAAWLEPRLGAIAPNRILVAGGAQSALFSICECLVPQGGAIAAGNLTYPGLKAVAAQRGLSLLPLAMDEGGIIPEAFEECCRTTLPKALYVIPAMDNPTTATLSEERRVSIASIARRYNVAIIEDDPYGALRSDVIPPFEASLAI